MKSKPSIYRSLSKMTFSLGGILVIVGLILGMFPQPVSAVVAPEWDKSSLKFTAGCSGNCDQIQATVCNGKKSGDMAGTTEYEVYWSANGNPKDGVVVASGTIPALKKGECAILTYDPKTNPNGSAGNYMFKAYQRPGHPGQGVLWSDQCSVGQCSLPTATPVTPTPFSKLNLTFMCGYAGDNTYLWRVRNPNGFAVNFTWDVYGGSENGSGTAPANGDAYFTTSTGSKTVRVFVNGVLNSTKASGQPCKSDLTLSYECSDGGQVWTVTNPNGFSQNFDWSASNGQSGSDSVPANDSTTIFLSTSDAVTLTITYSHDPFPTRTVSASSQACEVEEQEPTEEPTQEPTEEPTITPSETPIVTETPSPTPTEQPTNTPEPTEEPTEEPTVTPSETPIVTETPSPTPTEQPTNTPEPTEKTATPVGTDEPGSPTPEITETAVTTPQPTSSGRDEDRDQPPATLAPPPSGNTSVLIPVTGGDLSQPRPFGTTSLLLINFGLALLGFGLILNGLGRR